MKIGDLVILKNQRVGRYHLEGGYLAEINGVTAVIHTDKGLQVWPIDDLEKFTEKYTLPEGNEVVSIGGYK